MKNKIIASLITTLLLSTTVGATGIIQADSLKEQPPVITKNQSSVKEETTGKMDPIHAGDYTITGHVSKPNIIIAISVAYPIEGFQEEVVGRADDAGNFSLTFVHPMAEGETALLMENLGNDTWRVLDFVHILF